ncbi:MAG: alpha/beta fold hydrolase [Deltaproteobacteria bacterium]|nr:alpha/beta fold hydrolase [Deltaproteobacteria bacterium]
MEEQVLFPVGEISLEGLYAAPTQASQVGAVVCHPHPLYGGEMNNNIVTALVRAFQQAGMATVRFNFRGVGRSGGSHDQGNAEVEDVKAAVTYLLSRQSLSTVIVAGYSFGSMVGLRAGAADDRVHKLIGVALPMGFGDPSFLLPSAKPKLLISGDNDNYCPLPTLNEFFAKLVEPKTLVTVTGADHFFGGQEGEVAKAVMAFLSPSPGY